MADLTTLRHWYNNFTRSTGEYITHTQFWCESKWDWDWITNEEDWMKDSPDLFPRPSWLVAPVGTIWSFYDTPKEILDFEFDCGYGAATAPPLLAWSKSYVIYIYEYDGSQMLKWMPRFPEKFAFPEPKE